MPPVSTSDFKNGITIDIPEGLMQIIDFQHVKPGKGGAFVRTKMRNVRTGAVIDRTYNAGEKMEQAIIDKREMQFLYRDGSNYVFMDNSTYDQIEITPTQLGDAINYLKEQDNAMVQHSLHDLSDLMCWSIAAQVIRGVSKPRLSQSLNLITHKRLERRQHQREPAIPKTSA